MTSSAAIETPAKHRSSDLRYASVETYSSVARTVDILSDAWGFLVLRECFFGVRRFDHFRAVLRVPRITLAERLAKFLELDLLSESPLDGRHEYRLTGRGRDLYQTILALLAFGDEWLARGVPPPLRLLHLRCGCECHPRVACSHCKESIDPRRIHYRDGPGAGVEIRTEPRQRSRRTATVNILKRVRPCSVARTLQIIGDRWSFLILREFFYGVRRFDEFQGRLSIATNILTDRLSRLCAEGVVERMPYQDRPARYEYVLTAKGRDLYGSMLVMMHWGDKWLAGGKPPLKLRHRDCGQDVHAIVVCDRCGQELDAHGMSYATSYSLHGRAFTAGSQ
ncbi:winged helix-turn-helix transcriptional regulator [Cupriavidus sp. 8B]